MQPKSQEALSSQRSGGEPGRVSVRWGASSATFCVEAHGAWWLPRSSKPLSRALAVREVGSIPMRFRHHHSFRGVRADH